MNEPLREGIDYTIENGLYVFTAEYLRRRGNCCRSGCRHCPYGFTTTQVDSVNDGTEAPTDASDEE